MVNLYHYYDSTVGPFRNLSDNSTEQANKILQDIAAQKPDTFCAKRAADYMDKRRFYEEILKREFEKKGGLIQRNAPHYMIVEQSEWLSTWFTNSAYIQIPVEEFDPRTISFTYGDSHPTFSGKIQDGKEYRNQLYTYDKILKIIDKYGLPQEWNSDGRFGPERYIEVHIWSDDVIRKYGGKGL